MKWTEGEYEIKVDESGRFSVGDDDADYDTLEQARERAKRMADADRKIKRAKVSLAVISSDGVFRTLTGVHSGNGAFLLTPKMDRFGSSQVIPRTDPITRLLGRGMFHARAARAFSDWLRERALIKSGYRDDPAKVLANAIKKHAEVLKECDTLDAAKLIAELEAKAERGEGEIEV